MAMLLIWLDAAQATSVAFDDAPPENSKLLERRLSALEQGGASRQVEIDSLTSWLQADGYLDTEVYHDSLGIVVRTGERANLWQVASETGERVTLGEGVPFTRAGVDLAMNQLLQDQFDSGHYYARARLLEIVRDGQQVTIYVSIIPGPQVTVAERVYSGLERTQPSVISRYISLNSGDSLTESALQAATTDAASIPFVRFVAPVVVYPKPGYVQSDIEFTFRERRQFEILGVAGYIPDDATGLVWSLDLRLRNPFGGGREINLRSERREKERKELDLYYEQPVFLAGVGQLSLRFTTRDYRKVFYEFGGAANYTSRLRRFTTAGIGLGWKRVDPTADIPGQSSYSAYAVEFCASRNSVDIPFNPTKGLDLQMSLAYSYRRDAGESNNANEIGHQKVYNETRSRLSIRAYHRLIGRLVGYLGLHYIGLETDDDLPPLAEMILVGGPGTLRGYRNQQFVAQRTVFGTLEPRVRFESGYLSFFYDAAYLNRPIERDAGIICTEELFRGGFGIGLALHDNSRRLLLSLGWNDQSSVDQPRLSIEFSSDL